MVTVWLLGAALGCNDGPGAAGLFQLRGDATPAGPTQAELARRGCYQLIGSACERSTQCGIDMDLFLSQAEVDEYFDDCFAQSDACEQVASLAPAVSRCVADLGRATCSLDDVLFTMPASCDAFFE